MTKEIMINTCDHKISEDFIKSYFDIENHEGHDKIKITVAKGSSYYPCSLKELFNPKYGLWERMKLILKSTIEASGCPSIAAQNSCNYDNILLLLAFIEERIDELDLELWRERFNSKFSGTR